MSAAKEVLAQAFDVSITEVPDDAGMETFTPWDSLGHLKVIAAIEEKIGRDLNTEEVLAVIDLASIEKLIAGVHRV